MRPQQHIIIAGGICTGKTTLSSFLADNIKSAIGFPERKGTFLAQFYKDPSSTFMNQLDYSIQMMERLPAVQRHRGSVVEDRSIFDTHEVFSTMMAADGLMIQQQFDVLARLYDACRQLVHPTLLIFLDCAPEVSLRRVTIRNDREERGITLEYLSRLRTHYLSWYARFDLCRKMMVETDAIQLSDMLKLVASKVLISEE